MVGVKEVARAAGVSVGTVSNVLNRPASVSEPLRQRVETAIRDLGFVPNESARQLRTGASRTIAVVVLDLANPFFTDVVAGAEEAAEEHDALVVVCNSAGSADREVRHLRRLEQQRVMGILLSPVVDEVGPAVVDLQGRGTPVVLLDRGTPLPDQRAVSVDDVLGGRLAGEHLRALGHRSVTYLGGPPGLRQVRERLAGLRAAVGAVDVVTATAMSVRAGSQAMAQVLAGDERPTAVFCANDLLAIGALNECLRRGVDVPRDVSLVGYDDIGFAATTTVPLTSVRQPRQPLGSTAVELLLDATEPGRAARPDRHVVFAPELVPRASSAAPRR